MQVINRQTLTRCLEEAASAARAQGHAVQAPPSIQACHTHLLSAIMRQSQLAQQGREIHSCHYILVRRHLQSVPPHGQNHMPLMVPCYICPLP